ncbi:MAG: hypothetical protein ACJAYY_002301 [Paraglaciecola sp.]|jgi:hypothetical protein
MASKHQYTKKNDKFIEYWKIKRTNKKNYTIKTSAMFSFMLSIIFCLISDGFTLDFLKIFPVTFLVTTIVYGLYVYFIEYNLLEKRYQKLKKEAESLNH